MKEFNYLVIALDDGYKWAIVYDRARMEVIYETYVQELTRRVEK